METFVTGDIVVVKFPFTDYSDGKKRPAFIIKEKDKLDVTICIITTTQDRDNYSISINNNSLNSGSFTKVECTVRCNYIITIEKKLIEYKIGKLKSDITNIIINKIVDYIQK